MNEARQRRKLHDLLDIALDCNGLQSRNHGMTGTLPTVFIDFSGHVACVTVRMYSNGWDSGYSADKVFDFDFDEDIPDEKIEEFRAAAKDALSGKSKYEALEHQIKMKEKELEELKTALEHRKENDA